jgi:Thyroid hormone-inducible hepatic protein Spot 14
VRDNLVNTDLFNLYNMLNSVKVDLLWGRNGQEESSDGTEVELREQNYDTVEEVAPVTEVKAVEVPVASQQVATETKGHVRRPSTVSVASSNSSTSTISDSESEVSSNENDSGIESEGQENKDKSLEVARQFRTHLQGLYQSLEQMTEAANYLTARYQSDIGAGNC